MIVNVKGVITVLLAWNVKYDRFQTSVTVYIIHVAQIAPPPLLMRLVEAVLSVGIVKLQKCYINALVTVFILFEKINLQMAFLVKKKKLSCDIRH